MLGILIFAAVLTYGTFALFHVLGKVGNSINSVPSKSMREQPKLTVEDMYSPNNNLSHFYIGDNYCSIHVSNKIIDKEDFVIADNITNLKNKVGRLLRNYATLEKDKNKELVIL